MVKRESSSQRKARKNEIRIPEAAKGLRTPERKKPKLAITGAADAERFSTKGNGAFAGGGNVRFDFPNQSGATIKRAAKLLQTYRQNMVFWQASQNWIVNQGSRNYKIKGYSPVQTKFRLTQNHVIKALADSATNALKRRGFDAEYEGKVPTNVKYPSGSNGKSFQIFIWFSKDQNQTFFMEDEEQ